MVSKQEYREIQERILALIHESGSSVEPPALLACLRKEGYSRELASTIMWEMIAAGYIKRSKDWRLSQERDLTQEVEVYA